jgi:hypothetical protein
MTRVAIDLGQAVEGPGPRAAGEGTAVRIPTASLPEFADIADFVATGESASGEFRCADCGYGAVVQQVLPQCPMCRGTVWERREAHFAR